MATPARVAFLLPFSTPHTVCACLSLPHAFPRPAVVLRGFYASKLTRPSRMITETKQCPQGYVCKGGIPSAIFNPEDPTALPNSEPTIKRCDKNQWTKEIGATSEEQCCKCLAHGL